MDDTLTADELVTKTATVDAPAAMLAAWRERIAPGVYENMAPERYHADDSLSASGMKTLLAPGCPAQYRYERDHPKPPKKVFDFGHAAHRLVLGAGENLATIDADNWTTKAARASARAARDDGFVPLLAADMEKAAAMAAVVHQHPIAGALFRGGRPELSLFWIDPSTGVRLRSRIDWANDPGASRLILGDYKGLALDTPLPTPTGWTTMRAVRVGEQLLDSAGQPCTVTEKSDVHMRRCYRVRFDDGSSVVCDDEHLWVTTAGRAIRPATHQPTVRSTGEIRATLKLYGQNQHRVAVAQPLALVDAKLPIHPYVLGCWLGDGAAAAGRITKPDDELFELIAACGYELGQPWRSATKCQTRTIRGLHKQLRLEGLLHNKHIPAAYLRAGEQQRLQLLRGLMDTDGSWNGLRHQAIFTTVDKAFAESVCELACTLGQRAIVHEYEAKGYGRTLTAYRVTFTPTRGLNPFKLSRKADQVAVASEVRSLQRVIVAVDEIPTVPTQCLAVDSPDRTYLCTEAMIPTHNTTNSVDLEAIEKAIYNYGYHVQDAQYRAAARACGLGGEDTVMVFVFQSKEPPFLVRVVQLELNALRLGRAKRTAAISLFAECQRNDSWPGYDDVTYAALPPWAEAKDEEYAA